MIEQILRLRRPAPFIIAGIAAVLASFLLPSRFSLLAALAVSLAAVQIFAGREAGKAGGKAPGTAQASEKGGGGEA
jgi:hypothetical protein